MQARKGTGHGRKAVHTAVLSLIALTVVAGAAYAGYKRVDASADANQVPTVAVTRGDIQSSVPAEGRLAVDQWELGFGVAGIVESVDVSEGESVTAGEVLATLRTDKADAQIAQARASVAAAQAKLATLRDQPTPQEVAAKQALVDAAESSLENARDAYRIVEEESRESTVSVSELQGKAAAVDNAESQVRIAEANLAAARVPVSSAEIDAAEAAVEDALAGLESATSVLDDHRLTAPADGVVVSISLAEGQAVSAGPSQVPAVVVADLGSLRVDGTIDEADAAAIGTGMPVEVLVDALGGVTLDGEVSRIASVAEVDANGLATFRIMVELDEDAEGLSAGMAVRLQVVTDRVADALVIPTAVVKRSDGKSVVTIVAEDGSLRVVPVELGKTDGKMVEVRGGLEERQRLVSGPVDEDAVK